MGNYHNRIMNIQATYTDSQDMAYENSEEAYREGHRDARHAAAEIALEAEREIENLIKKSQEDAYYIMSLENDLCNLKVRGLLTRIVKKHLKKLIRIKPK